MVRLDWLNQSNDLDFKKIRTTTIRMPEPVYQFAQEVVKSTEAGADTLNELIVSSLAARLKEIQDARIDASFSRAAHDEGYQAVSRRLYALLEENASESLPGRTAAASGTRRTEVASAGMARSHDV
jgi:hypothetical protein